MTNLSNLAMWSLILGFVSPPVLAFIQQPGWSERTRSFVAFLFSALVALGTLYFDDTLGFKAALDLDNYVTALLLTFVTTISTYRNFWKPNGAAPAIEAATSPTPDPGR